MVFAVVGDFAITTPIPMTERLGRLDLATPRATIHAGRDSCESVPVLGVTSLGSLTLVRLSAWDAPAI